MTRNTFDDNAVFSAVAWNAMVNASNFEGVKSGLAPSKGTGNFEVDVSSGTAQYQSDSFSVGSSSVTLLTADVSNPRVDLVTTNVSGSVERVTGTAASTPLAPDIPSNHVLVAACYVPAGASSLSASDIHDYRVFLPITDYPFKSADIQDGTVTEGDLAFNTATQSELNSHENDVDAHHSVPFLTTDDLNDLTYHTVQKKGFSSNLVNVSSSGIFLGGYAHFNTESSNNVQYIVDGGPTRGFQPMPAAIGNATNIAVAYLPPVEYSSSLAVKLHPGGSVSGVGFTK